MAKRKRCNHRKGGSTIQIRMKLALANKAGEKGDRKFAAGRRSPGRLGVQVLLAMPGSKTTKSRRVGGRTRRAA